MTSDILRHPLVSTHSTSSNSWILWRIRILIKQLSCFLIIRNISHRVQPAKVFEPNTRLSLFIIDLKSLIKGPCNTFIRSIHYRLTLYYLIVILIEGGQHRVPCSDWRCSNIVLVNLTLFTITKTFVSFKLW